MLEAEIEVEKAEFVEEKDVEVLVVVSVLDFLRRKGRVGRMYVWKDRRDDADPEGF